MKILLGIGLMILPAFLPMSGVQTSLLAVSGMLIVWGEL